MTGTEIEQRIAVNPVTGEVVDLALGTDLVAAARRDVVDAKSLLDAFARELDGELNARMDAENLRTAVIGDRWEIKTKPAFTEEYPPDQVEAALDMLIEAGKLAESVKTKILVPQPPPEPKVAKTEINKLLKHLDADVRDAISACKRQKPQNRTVTVVDLGERRAA